MTVTNQVQKMKAVHNWHRITQSAIAAVKKVIVCQIVQWRTKWLKKDWAMKKEMQIFQGLNDEASKASQESSNEETKSSEQNDKKRVHWSGVQMQGF